MIALDSSFLVAFRNTQDAHHAAAVPLMAAVARGEHGDAVILDQVVAETLTVLMQKAGMAAASRVAAEMQAPGVILQAGWPYLQAALGRFVKQRRPGLSVVDCILAEFCQANDAKVATFDRALARAVPEALP